MRVARGALARWMGRVCLFVFLPARGAGRSGPSGLSSSLAEEYSLINPQNFFLVIINY